MMTVIPPYTPPHPLPRLEFNRKRPVYVAPHERWTTLDEITYLRGLRARGKIALLKTALRMMPERRWYGDGMEVDPVRVTEALQEMINELEPGCISLIKQHYYG